MACSPRSCANRLNAGLPLEGSNGTADDDGKDEERGGS